MSPPPASVSMFSAHSGCVRATACRFPPRSNFVASLQSAAAFAGASASRQQRQRQDIVVANSDPVNATSSSAEDADESAISTAAVFVQTCVGSLSQVSLRMADARAPSTNTLATTTPSGGSNDDSDKKGVAVIRTWNKPVEIVSLVGTFAIGNGTFHLHLSISDAEGNVFGGHLMGGTVHTTVELVLGAIDGVTFQRMVDPVTGYRELVVSSSDKEECGHK